MPRNPPKPRPEPVKQQADNPMHASLCECLSGWNQDEIKALVTQQAVPDHWWHQPEPNVAFIESTRLAIQSEGLLFKYVFPQMLSALKLKKPHHLGNFLQKVKTKSLKASEVQDSLALLSEVTELKHNLSQIGPICESRGITVPWLKNSKEVSQAIVTNEMALEITKYKSSSNLTWQEITELWPRLFPGTTVPNSKNVRTKFIALPKKRESLRKKGQIPLTDWLRKPFCSDKEPNQEIGEQHPMESDSSRQNTMLAKMGRGITPFNCKVCEKEFHGFDKFRIHTRRHKNKMKRRQRIAGASFYQLLYRIKEVRHDAVNLSSMSNLTVTENRNAYPCQYCQKSLGCISALQSHIRIHTKQKPYLCLECGKSLAQNCTLKKHTLRTHTQEKPYQCNECQKSFADHKDLQRHVRTHSKERPYQCVYCQKCFKENGALKKHVKTHTNEKPYQCKYCQRSFAFSTSLKSHMVTHTKGGAYQCQHCQKTFSQYNALKTHIRTHTQEKPHQCEYCQKRFSDPSSLGRHVRTHTKEKRHQCEYCHKKFAEASYLTEHIRTHTKEKPFQCQVCGKGFAQRDTLRVHMRTHTKEKPYQCEYCQKRFGTRSHLKDHIRTHTKEKPYQCEHCQKRFGSYGGLWNHIRTHSKEKPYQCEYCQKRFAQKSYLKEHIRIHTKEKPYQCEHCQKRFRSSGGFWSHKRTHKKEKL